MTEIHASAADVIRMLRAAVPEIAKEVSVAVREVAKEGAALARQKASAQGFDEPGESGRGTGALVRDITYGAHDVRAFIRETATRDGYNYPAVYEFGQSRWGSRPFMRPAAQELVSTAETVIGAAVAHAVVKLNEM